MRFSIRSKLLAGFFAVLAILLALSGFFISQMRVLDAGYRDLLDNRADKVSYTKTLCITFLKMAYDARGYLLTGDPVYAERVQNGKAEIEKQVGALEPRFKSQKGQELMRAWKESYDDYLQYWDHCYMLQEAGREQELAAYIAGAKGVVGAVLDAADAMVKYQQDELDKGQTLNERTVKTTFTLAVVLVVLGLVLGVCCAFYIARIIGKPVKLLENEAAKIAAGDLTTETVAVGNRDELGQLAGSFNTMLANLKNLAGQLRQKSQALASSAHELAANAEETSASANETSSTMAEVAATVEEVAAGAQRCAQLSEETTGHAQAGAESVKNVITQMRAINESTSGVARAIRELHEAWQKITQIVDLITHIADQTNLLALNAAIEAARAGEQGRGFAVVAEEVRKLAEQSAGAAREIYTLITTIQNEAQQAVAVMDEASREVTAGSKVVQEVEQSFAEIIEQVRGLATQIQQVAAAAQEISSAVQNVTGAAEEQNAAMEEVSAAADGLARMAGELEALTGQFKLKM
ncbi:MAG: HAMP domain-containing methyl-accepting chemotaxis protein [Desulfotomaculales bacterium]